MARVCASCGRPIRPGEESFRTGLSQMPWQRVSPYHEECGARLGRTVFWFYATLVGLSVLLLALIALVYDPDDGPTTDVSPLTTESVEERRRLVECLEASGEDRGTLGPPATLPPACDPAGLG